MKLITTLLLLFIGSLSFAQNNVFFFKKNGTRVYERDSAEYIRVFLPPADGTNLFIVNEFYNNGSKKMSGTASAFDPVRLQGPCTQYNEKGAKIAELNYDNNYMLGVQQYFYNNGKPYQTFEYLPEKQKPSDGTPPKRPVLIKANYDSTGTAQVMTGNGFYKGYGSFSGNFYEEGEVKNGKRTGIWKGRSMKNTFTETYKDGELVSGKSANANGKEFTYTENRSTLPFYKGGITSFFTFLKKTVNYPEYELDHKIQGSVTVSFVIDTEGRVVDARIVRPVSPGLNAEALRAVSLSPGWVPATQFGQPVRVQYTVPVSFTL